MIVSVSPNPRVVTTAVLAPAKAKMALLDCVVAWTKRWASASKLFKRNIEVVSSLLEAIDDAFSQVTRRGQRFADNGASIRFVEDDDVGERAANINRNRIHRLPHNFS